MSSSIQSTPPKRFQGWQILFASWLAACGAGLGALAIYSSTPEPVREASLVWPANSKLDRRAGGGMLVMFVHPQCPCSRASLSELEELLAHSDGRLSATIVFLAPENAPWASKESSLKALASRISGVHTMDDTGSEEGARFGATTSGETFVYDAKGGLVFHGGITAARGHAGINAGRIAIQDWATEGTCPLASTPVYGCPLSDDSRGAGL